MVIIQLKPLDKIVWNASDMIRVWYTQDSKPMNRVFNGYNWKLLWEQKE